MMYHPFSIECTLVRLYIVRVDHKKLFKILTLDILYTGMPEKGETHGDDPYSPSFLLSILSATVNLVFKSYLVWITLSLSSKM